MKVHIIVVAYNLPDQIKKLFATATSKEHDLTFHLFLHSKHEGTLAACREVNERYNTNFHNYGFNRGLSTSWNDGILSAYNDHNADLVIVANDDIFFSPGDIDKMTRKAVENRDRYIISVAGHHMGYNRWVRTHGYSCYALNPITLDKIGCFDENIFPVYLEDCDHHYRATLAGLVEENCNNTLVYHGGSSAINHDKRLARQNIITHRQNANYYYKKWGGLNGEETYKIPFNNSDFDLMITPEDRHAPYPGHNRVDFEDLVKL